MAKKNNVVLTKENLEDFLTRKYGENIILNASDAFTSKPRNVLKTFMSLDISLSGGIPDGTTVLISGRPKAGKTTLCLSILANAMKENRPTFYFNVERRCSDQLLNCIKGLDKSKLKVVQSSPEQILTAEDFLDILERIIRTQKKAVIVVDSIAMLSTMTEQQEVVGSNKDMAGTPKLLSSFFRRNQQIVDNNDIILILISQVITNRDPGGKRWVERGGVGVQYANSTWINVSYIKMWEKNLETNAIDGHDINLNIVCSALGKPFIPCSVPLKYGEGIDTIRDLINNAENFGIVDRKGAWYYLNKDLLKLDEELKFQGINKLLNYVKENPTIEQKIDNILREIIFSGSKNP